LKNLYDVLRDKENQVQQLQEEVEVLGIAVRLLTDDEDAVVSGAPPSGVAGQNRGAASQAGVRQFP
jgi:hypothetical protein